MKMIVAILRPHALETARQALADLGVAGMTAVEARGYGRQQGHTEIYRGAEYKIEFVPKTRIEVVVEDDMVDRVIETLTTASRTGKIGDGKIFTLPVDGALRVRTGETGGEAL
ncbi:MAG: P-II family nitrogen regulator [Rhodobacteraceae bacterium]|nr:P-II family nitrogen regulator [Paracoccaceae bacterium]